jgi:predicted lipoprotein
MNVAVSVVDSPGGTSTSVTPTGRPRSWCGRNWIGAPSRATVDTAAPTGPMTVEVPRNAQNGGAPLPITIATGPVIAGTAIRDAVGFIAFGDFTNQIAYANVANEINNKVKTDVVAKVDRASLTGKKITFYGAFSALSPGLIFLVPTELEVAS